MCASRGLQIALLVLNGPEVGVLNLKSALLAKFQLIKIGCKNTSNKMAAPFGIYFLNCNIFYHNQFTVETNVQKQARIFFLSVIYEK